MAKAIYNPKGKGADIKRFVWDHTSWFLKVGELKKFPDNVAEAMLRTFGFLTAVTDKNIAEIKKEIEEKEYKCNTCGYETNTKIALLSHLKNHQTAPTEEEKFIEDIPEASPEGSYYAPGKRSNTGISSPEQGLGIPVGGSKYGSNPDRDGVDWYGEGWEEDKKN